MPHDQSLDLLQASLEDLRQARLSVPAFCQTWRSQTTLLSALPTRFHQAMEDLLGRMEAGALFSEESCSFSQEDLQAALKIWLEKARQTLIQG